MDFVIFLAGSAVKNSQSQKIITLYIKNVEVIVKPKHVIAKGGINE